MTSDELIRAVARLSTRRPTKVIAGGFFSASMFMLLVESFRGYALPAMLGAVGIATLISLIALGLRWIERRIPKSEGD